MSAASPRVDFDSIGPRVGEPFPDVRLPDQSGQLVDLHRQRGSRRALVVFYRSADWCPFCKTQLVELQRSLEGFEAADVAVFAISYDPVAVLAGFAESYGITFPLLSDEGSLVIERLGLLNTHVEQQLGFFELTAQARHQRMPYPGTFVLDGQGQVVERYFEQSYRDRPSGGYLLHEVGGAAGPGVGASDQAAGAGVEVTAWTDESTYRPLEKAVLHVRMVLAEGHHAYVEPVPHGYVPLTVRPEPADGVRYWEVATPSGAPHVVTGLDEEFHVVDGTVDLGIPYVVSGRRHLLDGRPRPEVLPDGRVTLAVEIGYQVCTDEVCHPPSVIRLQVSLDEQPLVGQS